MSHRRSSIASLLRMREYIHKSLYDANGYFQAESGPVLPQLPNRHANFLDFPTQEAYQRMVANRFLQKTSDGKHVHGWLTPVELFSPFLSRAIARRIARCHRNPNKPLCIVEIGGGSGTLCSDILEYLAGKHGHDVHYTIVEISPALAEVQRSRLQAWIASGSASVVCQDAVDFFAVPTATSVRGPVHFIACEVLDNMAHDLVRQTADGKFAQAYVEVQPDADDGPKFDFPRLHWESSLEPEVAATMDVWGLLNPSLPESWVDRVLSGAERIISTGIREFWVPVHAQRMLTSLAQSVLPLQSVTVMDFARLPGALPGTGAPVVQRVDPYGSARMYESVLDAPFGSCDIMFPVSFQNLKRAFWSTLHSRSGSSQISTQSDFFQSFALGEDVQHSTCQDGYNPILSEFRNASVFTAELN